MVFFVLEGGEYALRYLRYKQLSRKIVKMSLVDKEFKLQCKIKYVCFQTSNIKHQTSQQTFDLVPQAKLSVIQYIAIRHSHRRNFSVLTTKLANCFAAFNGCKTFKMDTKLVFSTFDRRLLTLDF
jgi:hypothetical protein